METPVSLVHIPGDSIQSASDIIDVQSVADFLQSIGDQAQAFLPRQDQNHEFVIEAPFVEFINILLSTEPGKITGNSGAAEWTGYPIETLIAQGIWPIMMKIAEKQNHALGTETDVLERFAPQAEQLLNIGIMLCYGSAEAAAREFKHHIALSQGEAGTKPQSLAMAVQMPVAKFFASMLKTVIPTREKLLAKIAELRLANHAFAKCDYVSEYLGIKNLPSISELQNLGKNMDGRLVYTEAFHFNYQDLRFIGDALMAHEMAIRVAKKLPAKPSEISDDEMLGRIDKIIINYEWLITQILLAAVDAPPDEKSVGTEAYTATIKHCQSLADDEIIAKTLRRFETRGVPLNKWTADEQPCFMQLIQERISLIKSMDPNGIHHAVLTHYSFESTSAGKVRLTHDQAMALAVSKEPMRSKILAYPQAVTDISASLNWSKILIDDLYKLIHAAILPPANIANGMLRMPEYGDHLGKAWREACEELKLDRKIDYATPEAVEILEKHGIIKPKQKSAHKVSYRENPTLIPVEQKADYLCKLMQDALHNEYVERGLATHFIQIVTGDILFAKKFFMRPDIRETINNFFVGVMQSKADRRQNGVTDSDFLLFLTAIGEKLWLKFVLTSEILFREDTYTRVKTGTSRNNLEEIIPPWEKLEEYETEYQRPSKSCKIKPRTITRLLKTPEYSEEGIFRWYYEADPKLEANLKKYLKARDRYFRIVG